MSLTPESEALLRKLWVDYGISDDGYLKVGADVAAIEHAARQAERERLRTAVEKLDSSWDRETKHGTEYPDLYSPDVLALLSEPDE